MFSAWYVFAGFVVGMMVCSIFIPPVQSTKMLPDPARPNLVFKNAKVDNGFFQVKSVETACTNEVDSLNLMSVLHK